ncbi:uncharacterized protein arhgef33 isoform X2 [Tachysurus vachellii]|uniref:uncharacterized protein arhgef33 isoform X2 n=1 Tax=Tachysurus vachellii TaxID=175792 RepID=UPI00296AB11C|nr:uncharacterized protein arhgef33 isoform X2 [Tachysurus vachellii]
MENKKTEDAHMDDPDLHMVQLQDLWAELKAGLRGVVQEISSLQQSNSHLEEKVSECHRDTAEKILSLRNKLNTLQEDTGTALSQISELSIRQKELQTDLNLLRSTQHSGKFSKGEELVEGHASPCSQTQLKLIQHYIASLPNNQSQRQVAALGLLESERVYVSYLSLLLKANITYNGCENSNIKDKRLFPSSLRFLIQQHLELLHLLQERVLKSHWQGIMGDVFLRVTSKESDFLDNYVSYLKELPECLSAASLFLKPVGLLEGDITGDETHPSLHTLLLQPVQRIPEYLRLLQSLLCQTESEHPDYYLLLVCVQHLRSFTSQYSNLLQHNQELLTNSHTHNLCTHKPDRMTHTHKEFSRSSVKQLYKVDYENSSTYNSTSALTDLSHAQSRKKAAVRRYPDWEPESNRFHPDISFASDSESRHKSTPSQLHRIPETDRAGSALADAMGSFLPYRDGDSHCSSRSHSTDSSIDIAFVSCSPSLNPDHQSHGRGQSSAGGVYRPNRGCVSPDSTKILQPVQRKSKSLNGLQLDSIDSPAHPVRSPIHPRLVRQSSAKSRLRNSSPERHHEPNTHTTAEELKQQLHKDPGPPIWEEFKWKGVSEEGDHAPLSERSRKEGKGFRSSFKKLFKKKSGGESKVEKAVEKVEGQSNSELESGRSNRVRQPGDIDRGTAV